MKKQPEHYRPVHPHYTINQHSITAILTAQKDFFLLFFFYFFYRFSFFFFKTIIFPKVRELSIPLVTLQAELNTAGASLRNISLNFIKSYFYVKPVYQTIPAEQNIA